MIYYIVVLHEYHRAEQGTSAYYYALRQYYRVNGPNTDLVQSDKFQIGDYIFVENHYRYYAGSYYTRNKAFTPWRVMK